MLRLRVTRCWFTDKSTMGILDINGVFQCYTLEPSAYSDGEVVVGGVTVQQPKPTMLIPVGTYKLALLPSKRFEMYTPHIMNVPGHTAEEIHPGNDAADTKGCTLVGKSRGTDWLGASRDAFNLLLGQLDAQNEMEIEYVAPVPAKIIT